MTDFDLSGDLSEYVYRKFIDSTFGEFRLGSEQFHLASLEEARDLGYEDDDPVILIRRLSDGAYFEAEIEAMVRPARKQEATPAEPPMDTPKRVADELFRRAFGHKP